MNLPSDPRQAYQSRLERYQNQLAALENRLDRIGAARLAAALIGLLFIGVVLGLQVISVWWLFAAPIPLIGLSIAKSRVLSGRDHVRRAAAFHERGLARIDD